MCTPRPRRTAASPPVGARGLAPERPSAAAAHRQAKHPRDRGCNSAFGAQKKEPRYPRGGRPRLQSLDAVITQGTCSGRKSRGQCPHGHHPKRNVADHPACATAKLGVPAGFLRSFVVKGSSDCVAPAPISRQPPAPHAPRRLQPRTDARTPAERRPVHPAGVRDRRPEPGPGHPQHAGRPAHDHRPPAARGRGMRRAGHPRAGAVPQHRALAEDARRRRDAEPRRPDPAHRARAQEAFPRPGRDDRRRPRSRSRRTGRTACSTRRATSSTTRPSRC